MIIYRVSKSLGLSVQLCRGLADEDDEESCIDFIVPSFQHRVESYKGDSDDWCDEEQLEHEFGNVENTENVRWCVWTNERKEPLLSSFYIFISAAVLIKVPEFTIDRGGASVKTVLNHIEVSEEIRKNEAVLPYSCEDC